MYVLCVLKNYDLPNLHCLALSDPEQVKGATSPKT